MNRNSLCIVFVALLPVALASAQEEEPRVRVLEKDQITRENLVDILKPSGPPPEGQTLQRGMARGLSVEPVVECEFYRERVARGLTVKPAADVPALPILFAFDSAEISPASAEILTEIGEALRSDELDACCFMLEGHADSIGSETYNLELSRRRAESVADYLAEHFGIEGERLLIKGFGESAGIASNATEEGRAQNRRVRVRNLGYGQLSTQ